MPLPTADDAWRPTRPVPSLLRAAGPAGESPTRPTATARVLYLALALVPLLLAALVVLARTGLTNPARAGGAPWGLAVVILAGLVCAAMAAALARRLPHLQQRARADAFDQRLSRIELAVRLPATVLSLLLATLALLAWGDMVPPLGPYGAPLLASLGVLVGGAPAALFEVLAHKRVHAMEARFPDFLRDLNESHAAGMTMAQAVRVAARGDYGALDDEVRRMANQVSWGASFPDALRMLAQRVPTPLVMRSVALVTKATRAGGNVRDVLAAAARDAREIKAIEEERRSGMAMYVIVVYVAFGVFLAVTAALQGLLVPSVLGSARGLNAVGALAMGNQMGVEDFRMMYFGAGLVQAVGSGIVAGVMSEGRATAGLKHAAILVALTVLVLGILL